MRLARLWGINIAVLEVMGLGGLLGIISMGAYYVSMGIMGPEKMMFVLYANYVAIGFRSMVTFTGTPNHF